MADDVYALPPDAAEFDALGTDLLTHTKFVPDNGNPAGDPIPFVDTDEWLVYVYNNPLGWGWGQR